MQYMITPQQARSMLGVSRTLFDRLKSELRPVRYSNNGKRFYDPADIQALIERKREGVFVRGGFENPEVGGWFK